ncbi:MAG: hypothetical protein ACKO1U_03335, partial [Bacteroidota bacterium]
MTETTYAQSVTACTTSTVVSRFGVDADLYSSTPWANTDDWFTNPLVVDSGIGIIGQSAATSPRGISAAAFRSLLQSGVGGMNYSYEQRMAFPYQTVIPVGNPPYAANILLDAVAARDNWTSSTPDSSGFLQSNKNGDNPKTWNIGVSNIPDKNDILDVGGHVRRFTTSPSLPGDLWGYAYASTKGTNGTSYVDFEIYRTAPVFTGANPA